MSVLKIAYFFKCTVASELVKQNIRTDHTQFQNTFVNQ